ncbi:MAG: class II fructose-bisphosphate aldolase [Actinobacteria bacterium]|nr:class II fructose-bisphosphate aldolase [Actinomycetota bacterium]
MAYVNTKEMLIKAREQKYVVGGFNIVNHTSLVAVFEAAKENRSPVIVQTSQKTVLELGYKVLPAIIKELADESDVPVAMILDHGTNTEIIKNCILSGWSSVMIDGSSYPYEENIKITKKIVELAHSKNVSVEGELGHIGGKEEHISVDSSEVLLTDPEKAVEFQKKTGIDSLAVAIGTKHGFYDSKYELDFNRLGKIMDLTDFPIVIHGCSGLAEKDLKRLISFGVSKMNISTEIKHIYIDSCRQYIEDHPDEYEPVKKISFVQQQVKDLVKKYMDIFGSTNKA